MIPIAPPTTDGQPHDRPLDSDPQSLFVMVAFVVAIPVLLWIVEYPYVAAQIGTGLGAAYLLGRVVLAYARDLAEKETAFAVPGTGFTVQLSRRTPHRS